MKTFITASIVLVLCTGSALSHSPDVGYEPEEAAPLPDENATPRTLDCHYDPDYDNLHCYGSYQCEDCHMLFRSEDAKEVRCPLCGSRRVVEVPE